LNSTEVLATFDAYAHSVLFAEAVLAASYFLCCALMATGAACRKRALMVPYLVFQLLLVLLFLVSLGASTAVLFVVDLLSGCVSLGVALITGFLFVYFYCVVRTAFVELGNRDYMYSPAPQVKPIYNPR